MDPIPLIPKSKHPENHDVSYLLREVFQDILINSEFSKNVAENVRRYNVEDQAFKDNCARVIQSHNIVQKRVDDFGNVEDELMINQGNFMMEKNNVDQDVILTESIKLKRKEIFLDLDINKVRQYGLLQKIDLLPSKPERSMDFRINPDQHVCSCSCECIKATKSDCRRYLDQSQFDDDNGKALKSFKKNLISNKICLSPARSDLDLYPTKLARSVRKRKHTKPSKVDEKQEPEHRAVIFKAEPEAIIFEDYVTETLYEKRFKLRNVSKQTQSFIPRALPKTSYFKVELQTKSTRVAPGMVAVFSVQYYTDIYKDVEEIMLFNTYTGCDVKVSLISTRRPPKLTVFVYKSFKEFAEKFTPPEELDKHDQGRVLALNSTIDCGSCLLGKKLHLNLILKNDGSHGQFFILNEDDWYLADIVAVNKDLELTTRSFNIHPTYFEIDTNEFVELDVTFFPRDFGLEVEKVFLLCNNNTLEELEVVGDGVFFEINSVTLEAESKLQNMLNMDAHSGFIIKYGKCIPYQKCLNRITVHNNRNNSLVDFKYKWSIRESVCHIKNTTLRKMDPSWIKMDINGDYIPAQSTFDFPILLECKTKQPGFYSLVFILYVLDIPEACLAEDKTFYVIENAQVSTDNEFSPKLLDIIIGEVEVSCEVIPIHFQMDPNNTRVPYALSYDESFKQKIQIYTAAPVSLQCEWKLPPKVDFLNISPLKFTLKPESAFICDLDINVRTYKDIDETASFIVNGGLLMKDYKIVAKVIKPMAQFSENVLNFGFIPKGKNVIEKEFYVVNLGQEKLRWEIFEFYFDHTRNAICELDAVRHLTLRRGELGKNGSCKVTYTIDNTDEPHRWLSFLILLSSHPTLEAMNSLCLITYEIVQPELVIHTRTSQQPMLFPAEILYLNCTSSFMICLHNIGTKLAASFVWGKPVGKQAEFMKAKCLPRSGIIQPQQCIHISLTLQPLAACMFEDIYIPCFVGNTDEPIMLTVLCIVDNISLCFHLPEDNTGRLVKTQWPTGIATNISSYSLDLTGQMGEGHIKEDNSHEKLQILDWMHPSTTRVSSLTQVLNEPTISGQEEEITEQSEMYAIAETENAASIEAEEVIEEDATTSTSSTTHFHLLKNHFGSGLILQDHLIEYHNVPLRTPIKKTIFIENLTPIYGTFFVEATNFYAITEDECNETDDVLVELNIKKKDEWEQSINSDFGIVVKPKPAKGFIKPYDSVEVDVWVYANTWGVYVEEILIEVNDIIPFCFSMLIEAVGIPIEFPIALNANVDEPRVRFGNVPYLSKPLQRKLKISNFSSIPIGLVWHVFIIPETKRKKNQRKFPFNVIVDVSSHERSIKGVQKNNPIQVLLTNEYYGREDFHIFNIDPREIVINSKSIETITITLNVRHFKSDFEETNISANLIGFIKLAEEFIYQTSFYSRQIGMDVLPAKAKLLATLELPLLKLELVKGEKRIKTYANDIILATDMRYERVLVFRNVDNSPISFYMHIAAPFHIASIKTAQTNDAKDVTAAIVQPGECVEVVVECMMDAEQVLQYSDMLYNEKATVYPESPDFKQNSITLLRYLNIHQHGLIKQITSMELIIFYPRILVSNKTIDFGTVFIGNTKKMLLTLTNPTGSYVPFVIQKPITSDCITIVPCEGEIPKATGTTSSSIILSLYFIPKECKLYQEAIQIYTNIPFYYFNVELVGNATNDEKFYMEGT